MKRKTSILLKPAFLLLATLISSCSGSSPAESPGIEPTIHEVTRSDTLESIAEEYEVRPLAILQSNYPVFEDNPAFIEPGDQLRIPPGDGILYEWQKGDSLEAVASFFGVQPEAIIDYDANGLTEKPLSERRELQIEEGTLLFIPGGVRPLIQPPGAGDFTEECTLWYPSLPARCMY